MDGKMMSRAVAGAIEEPVRKTSADINIVATWQDKD